MMVLPAIVRSSFPNINRIFCYNVLSYISGHNSKGSSSSSSSSQFSTSTGTIRITTSSATPTSPVSTIIHKHDGSNSNNNSSVKDVVQSSGNSIMPSTQIQNSSKVNNDDNNSGSDEVRGGKMSSSWHQNSGLTAAAQKAGISSNYSSSLSNAEGTNDGNDSSKTNFSAMTKKRKAMHQANSSNRSSADENVNK